MPVHTNPNKRHDFVLIFDVTDGNPNGDPDAGNLPRTDPETMQGIVTDVALKRKVRNFVSLVTEDEQNPERLKIFVKHRGVLNNEIREAYVKEGMEVGERVEKPVEDAAVLEICGKFHPCSQAPLASPIPKRIWRNPFSPIVASFRRKRSKQHSTRREICLTARPGNS